MSDLEIVALYSIKKKNNNDVSYIKNIKIIYKDEFDTLISKHKFKIILAHNEYNDLINIVSYLSKKHMSIKQYYHPIVFVKNILQKESKYIITGFPGSGNVIYQNIYREIMIYKNIKSNFDILCEKLQYILKQLKKYFSLVSSFEEKYNQFCKNLASLYHNTIINFVIDNLGKNQIDYVIPNLVKNFKSCYLIKFKDEKHYSIINNIPIYQHFWEEYFVGQHGLNDESFYNKFNNISYKQIYILRNPLDIIVSNAGKVMMEITGKRDNVVNLINHKNYILPMIDILTQYLENIKKNKEHFIFFTYEELMLNPERVIKRFGSILNVRLKKKELKKISTKFIRKNLINTSNEHLWDAQSNKYNKYIQKKYLKYIEQSGLINSSNFFGYEFDFNYDDISFVENFDFSKYQDELSINDFKYSVLTNKKIKFNSKNVNVSKLKNNLNFCSTNKYFNKFNSLLEQDLFKKLF